MFNKADRTDGAKQQRKPIADTYKTKRNISAISNNEFHYY